MVASFLMTMTVMQPLSRCSTNTPDSFNSRTPSNKCRCNRNLWSLVQRLQVAHRKFGQIHPSLEGTHVDLTLNVLQNLQMPKMSSKLALMVNLSGFVIVTRR